MMEGVGRRLGTKGNLLTNIGSRSLNGREQNVLFRNQGNGTFIDVGWANGADRIEDGRGLALFDANGDGSLDIALRNYRAPAGLLINKPTSNHWVGFELNGTESNRDAVGARIQIRSGDHEQTRVVSIGGSYLSSNSLRQHFGMGTSEKVEKVTITWPSGRSTHLENLPADRLYQISETPTGTVLPTRPDALGVDRLNPSLPDG